MIEFSACQRCQRRLSGLVKEIDSIKTLDRVSFNRECRDALGNQFMIEHPPLCMISF